jgi:ectoine hydroxylase-related dioxygenase (phytanoyl-CoA dioxygenase family)
MLTGTQSSASILREQYARDGFYLHDSPHFPPDMLDSANRGMDLVRAGESDTGRLADGGTWKPGDDPAKLCKIENPQLASRAVQAFLRHKPLGELVAAVTGARRVQVWWVQLLYKPPTPPAQGFTNTAVGWHQDLQYWSKWEDESELITAWVALSDVTADSGPMRFARGSHRWGFLNQGDFFGQDNQSLRSRIRPPLGEAWDEVPALLPAGGVSLHPKLTFHASDPNVSAAPRRSFAIHLCLNDARPKSGPDMWIAKHLHEPEICPVIYGGVRR